jgi:murein L,D-transpeptidase YcbB/YkuD
MGMAFAKISGMKKVFISAAILTLVFTACKNNNSGEEQETDKPEQKKISKRDLSIDVSNAYNDIFLDSMALENFITEKQVSAEISRRLRSFYNARNFQYAWFASDGLTEQARGFWNLHDYATTYGNDTTLKDKELQKRMERLIAEETLSVSASDKSFINTEFKLTQHFIQYTLNAYDAGYVKRKEMERFIPLKKVDALYLADSLLNKKHKDNKYFEDVNELYKRLKDQLGRYYEIAKKGGWQPILADAKEYKPGMTGPAVLGIKRRLMVTGEMPAGDTTDVYTDTLANAVMAFQQTFGYKPNGNVTTALLNEMNVPVTRRIQQILINMDRMRWMPAQPKGRLIQVNIPEFMLHVTDNNQKVFDMAVVVGKEGHNTMMFTGDLNQVVFSPYWNVPESIVKKEILPEMDKNPYYLEEQNMEITGTVDGLPVVRQLPGEKNSLGKVKFLFPNSFDIYFHDTPAKSLFSKDKRAYSHGCIRLSDPMKMAEYVLNDNPEWTTEKIIDAMNSGKERYVKVKNPIPVFISYYTAWVDETGRLNFREDIYGHDAKMAAKMFINNVSEPLGKR